MPIEIKYKCPICGYESNAPGLCPTDDENMQKLCHCGSGKYSLDCCELIKEVPEEKEELAAAEVKAEEMAERLQEAEIVEEQNEKENPDEE